MTMLLLGYKLLDFLNDQGQQVKGTQLFVAHPDEGVIGQRVDKLFIKDGFDLPELTLGVTLDVAFNRRGKPEKVTLISTNQRPNLSK